MPNPVGIMTMRDVRGVGLNPKHRHIMTDKLRSLFSNEWLEGLNDDQLYDLFEEFIDLPGLTHIGYEKPPKESTDSNIIDLHPYLTDKWWLIKPSKPEEEDEI